eukprot:g5322.t1
MSSTYRQRYFLEEEENRVGKPFTGKVHLLTVALDYEGTDSPLNCVVDSERICSLAAKSGVKNIVKIFDADPEAERFACQEDVVAAVREIAERCTAKDYFVFHYSGHGTSIKNDAAPTGVDCALCLRTRDGEDEEMVDDEIADLISKSFPPATRVLMMADCCHSGGVMDLDTAGLWGDGRRVCCISGCQEGQLSVDSGDGGVMTNALLKVLKRKTVAQMRKKRGVSVQYIFNRMVEFMPDDEESEEEEEEEDSDEW